MGALKSFLIDLTLTLVPILIGGIVYTMLSISTLQAEAKHIRDVQDQIIQRIEKRLERIEEKIDAN